MSLSAAVREGRMAKLKRALRVTIKIVLTPLVLIMSGFIIATFSAFGFYERLGDREDNTSKEIVSDWTQYLKQWFTRL